MDREEVLRRLRNPAFTMEAARRAVAGQELPEGLARRVLRLCVIRGIRYHDAFAQDSAKVLHDLLPKLPEFKRALNARAIMSNRIPDMSPDSDFAGDMPYCIWHPEVATEDTYRRLVQRYPAMAYQVARACAVAGYTDLYRELDILPEVHVAEEARANGSTAIFELIMAEPVRYKIMDDYTRTVCLHAPTAPAYLNGDTCVRPMLDEKEDIREPTTKRDIDDPEYRRPNPHYGYYHPGFKRPAFNITEDMNVSVPKEGLPAWLRDDYEPDRWWEAPRLPWTNSMAELLTTPLPQDLPEGNKDLLIIMAAYYGDIDRYVRLRRPTSLADNEAWCIVRGIYHNSLFAAWFASRQTAEIDRLYQCGGSEGKVWAIVAAIDARFIMDNNLSRLVPYFTDPPTNIPKGEKVKTKDYDPPYMIWYPKLAAQSTYAELARQVPSMRQAVARACVFGNFKEVFDQILAADPEFCPDVFTLREARISPQPRADYYEEAIMKRARELGRDVELKSSVEGNRDESGRWAHHDWRWPSVRPGGYKLSDSGYNHMHHYPETYTTLYSSLHTGVLYADQDNIDKNVYNDIGCDAGPVEMWVGLPEEWRPVDGPHWVRSLDYVSWPPKETPQL
ncbi:hypothetical protein QBC46DRAFT_441086 [Diplogelasinospora grovesii]|uniref:Uncharacterized protein n=1 Tax=Diplogelasinospora grovesii TaxID=303347 RepID=A0AAN6N3E1_9PEZI|nr:hypothetical protein QBC46DRAFT_441086 [Diplogelasinospora grovesii]